jgi:glycine cleavage system aminomethyltransferase T
MLELEERGEVAGLPLKRRNVPINLRQSGGSDARIKISTRIRKGPYWHLSQAAGCWCYTVYNHVYHPRAYVPLEEGGLMKEYEYLTEHVTLWNVAVERQIQIKGPDAAEFVNLLITRDVHKKLPPGQARYVILCDEKGGIINDPVLLRIADDEFWFSISDSDVALWAKGVNYGARMNVEINEIDVAPVQIQGPKARALMRKLFGDEILKIRYYGVWSTKLNGLDVVISRTGFSAEPGYEIYLHDATIHADEMWNAVMEAGREFNIRVIAPSHIRRLEAGILSYGADMDLETNPFEVGLDWQIDFSKERFIGKEALLKIKEEGIRQKLCGLKMGGAPITWYNADFYPVKDHEGRGDVGYVTSAAYGYTVGRCIAYGYLLASGRSKVIVEHDSDILTYDRDLLARLTFPVVDPHTAYRFTKGYYARTSDRLHGRVMRLLVTPLVRALRETVGDHPFLTYLDAYRYALSGEFALETSLARRVRMPSDWGLEVGLLAEVYRHAQPDEVSQTDIADAFDHKHQDLSRDDPNAGLRKMATDIAKSLLRTLASEGVRLGADTLRKVKLEYRRISRRYIDRYEADARLNQLLFDRRAEERAIATFAEVLRLATQECLRDPHGARTWIPSWDHVEALAPGTLGDFHAAVEAANAPLATAIAR